MKRLIYPIAICLCLLGCFRNNKNNHSATYRNDEPFLDCFTGLQASNSNTNVDCQGALAYMFFTYTHIDDNLLLVIRANKNQVALSNICNTFALTEKNPAFSVKVVELSEAKTFYTPCSDVYSKPSADAYYPSKGTVTVALANFTQYGKYRTIENEYRLLALVNEAEFVNPDTKETIQLDDFYLGYSDEIKNLKLKNVDSSYRVSFPVIKPLNPDEFIERVTKRIAEKKITKGHKRAYLYFRVARSG